MRLKFFTNSLYAMFFYHLSSIYFNSIQDGIVTVPTSCTLGTRLLHLIIYCCNIKAMQCHYNFNRFITSFTITSFSSDFDSAIINVIATNVPSLSLFSPSKNNALFLSKNSRNSDAAILSPLYQVHLQASLTEYQLFS